jgi:KUP system potassium uptake protein
MSSECWKRWRGIKRSISRLTGANGMHVSHENLVPGRRMGLLKRLRFRLFMLLRLVSQPAYYYYGLGDEVQLSVEIIPVRVR